MAKGFKHGGSGGTSLNFKVVINPQPETAKENTIWVNTDVPIPKWYFSVTQPENMADGEVWFRTGLSSFVAFSALKKQNIMLYPVYTMQYVNGELASKTASIYQNGAWRNVLVPAEYQAVEYIEGTGTQYINCDVAPQIAFAAEMNLAFTNNATVFGGVYNASGGYSYRSEFTGKDGKFGLYSNDKEVSVSTQYVDVSFGIGEMALVKYEQGNGYQRLTVKDSTVQFAKNTSARDTFTLMRFRGGGVESGAGRIGNVKVYNGGELVRDMIPCYRIVDSVAGMYDRIDNRFFTNAGSGTFVVGADV